VQGQLSLCERMLLPMLDPFVLKRLSSPALTPVSPVLPSRLFLGKERHLVSLYGRNPQIYRFPRVDSVCTGESSGRLAEQDGLCARLGLTPVLPARHDADLP
jgi:hypothetical protein